MSNYLRVKEIFNDVTNCIFTYLNNLDVPWKDDNIDDILNIDYVYNYSGEKIVSNLVKNLLDYDEDADEYSISDTNQQVIANIIYNKYIIQWNNLYNTLFYDYNAIENYSMTEKLTNDITSMAHGKTQTRTDNLTTTDTTSNTRTDNLTNTRIDALSETTTPNLTNVNINTVSAFNSSSYVDKEKSTQTNTGTQGHTNTGTQTNTNTGTQTSANSGNITNTGTQTFADSGTDTNTRNYTLTRTGNIGTLTTQQMIESERKLWDYNFFNEVYKNIDSIITLKIY